MIKEGLELWFEEFKKTIAEKNIRIDIYNIYEIGFAIGTVQRLYIVVKKESTKGYQAHPSWQE